MTQVDFHIQIADKLLHTCKLVRKAYNAGNKVVCYSQNKTLLNALDEQLWTFAEREFIPHVWADDAQAHLTPVLLTATPCDTPHHDVLINLDAEWPPFFSRFARLIEIVDQTEEDKVAARERFRFYRDRGYPMQTHDMSPRA